MKIKNCGWEKLAKLDEYEIQMYSDDKIIRFDVVWNEVDWKMFMWGIW